MKQRLFKYYPCIVITGSIILILCANQTYGQGGFFKKVKEKIERKIDSAANNATDRILNGGGGNTNQTQTKPQIQTGSVETGDVKPADKTSGRPKLSEISDDDFTQHTSNPAKNNDDTRIRLAGNLFVDMTGKYPIGYDPKWRFISYPSSLSVEKENWFRPTSQVAHAKYPLTIGEYNNKAVVRLTPVPGCECFADILIKNDFTVLNNQPQTFKITNFRKILNERSTGEACMNAYNNNRDLNGGYEGKITLAANENGDITMDFMMEYYSEEWKERDKYNKQAKDYDYIIHPKQVSYRYSAKNITIENEMSPVKANAIVAAEIEAKQKQKDYVAKMTKQSDSLQKIITNKYPGAGCKDCFVRNSNSSLSVTPTTTVYTNGYGDVVGTQSGSDWDINTKTTIKNKCNYPLKFVGIQQFYDTEKGYYLKEVTKVMEAGYSYNADQGIMSSLFTSFVGGGSEFNIAIQDKYVVSYAGVGVVQWLKVIKN
jgi:hypothetical protein